MRSGRNGRKTRSFDLVMEVEEVVNQAVTLSVVKSDLCVFSSWKSST